MESGLMRVVFSSIINGNHEKLPVNKAVGNSIKETPPAAVFKPRGNYFRSRADTEEFKDKSSREVFASLVNAHNCANLQNEKALDDYMTFTQKSVFMMKSR